MYRGGLERFKKAQTIEPFSVVKSNSKNTPTPTSATKSTTNITSPSVTNPTNQNTATQEDTESATPVTHKTQIGGGQSAWQPPDWSIEPRPGVYYLEVLKDGEVIDKINLDKRRHIFGRQFPMCDFVLDHQSVSRQHAAVVPHKNGSIYVIDLGSVHGTFVANERLTKDNPVELEIGQSLRFAASTRSYILRKNNSVFLPTTPTPAQLNLPSPPDPDDLESVVAYNTILNRYGIPRPDLSSNSSETYSSERPAKRSRKARVSFRDQAGGELTHVVGISDGSDVGPGPVPIDNKEGIVGKYESLVQVTVIPKGKEPVVTENRENSVSPRGVTEKLQQVMDKVKAKSGGIYDDIYGDLGKGKIGTTSWAYKLDGQEEKENSMSESNKGDLGFGDEIDDLFGDS